MNIRSVSNFTNRFAVPDLRHRIFDLLPNITVNNERAVCNIGRVLSRPDVGRAIMGATAILTQPLIDYYNPKVDRDTAEVSTCRTIGKILAGTTVGCMVRSACYYGVRAMTKVNPNAPTWRTLLMPPDIIVQHLNAHHADWIKNYNSLLATLIGMGIMLFTNVMLDVPLTNIISKSLLKLIGKSNPNQPQNVPPTNGVDTESANDVKVREPYDVKEKFRKVFFDDFADRNTWRAGR